MGLAIRTYSIREIRKEIRKRGRIADQKSLEDTLFKVFTVTAGNHLPGDNIQVRWGKSTPKTRRRKWSATEVSLGLISKTVERESKEKNAQMRSKKGYADLGRIELSLCQKTGKDGKPRF